MSLFEFTSNEGNTSESHPERFMNYRANFLSVSLSVSWHNPHKKNKCNRWQAAPTISSNRAPQKQLLAIFFIINLQTNIFVLLLCTVSPQISCEPLALKLIMGNPFILWEHYTCSSTSLIFNLKSIFAQMGGSYENTDVLYKEPESCVHVLFRFFGRTPLPCAIASVWWAGPFLLYANILIKAGCFLRQAAKYKCIAQQG